MQRNLYQITYICGIKNFHNPLQHWIILPFILLADQLNVPQFPKVEVSLLLQIFNSKFQYIDLPKDINNNSSTKDRIQQDLCWGQGPRSSQEGGNMQSTSEVTKMGEGGLQEEEKVCFPNCNIVTTNTQSNAHNTTWKLETVKAYAMK